MFMLEKKNQINEKIKNKNADGCLSTFFFAQAFTLPSVTLTLLKQNNSQSDKPSDWLHVVSS